MTENKNGNVMEVGGKPPIYCFVLFYRPNLLAQFVNVYP